MNSVLQNLLSETPEARAALQRRGRFGHAPSDPAVPGHLPQRGRISPHQWNRKPAGTTSASPIATVVIAQPRCMWLRLRSQNWV